MLADLKTNMQYNLSGIGYGKAATADYLFKPHLLERPSLNPIAIKKEYIDSAMAKLTKDMPSSLISGNAILFLGSDFVELGMFSTQQEIIILKKLSSIAEGFRLYLVYKPHPSETADKLALYKQEVPSMSFLDSFEPIEVIYNKHSNLKFVVSYGSTGLLYSDLFSKSNVKAISLMRLYGAHNYRKEWEKMLDKAGVLIPEKFEQVELIFKEHGDNDG